MGETGSVGTGGKFNGARAGQWKKLTEGLGQSDQAEAAYRRAIAQYPKNAAAHYNFGVVSLQRERLGQARAAFEATFTDNPAHAEALNSVGAIV